jgi:hypothetical protein
VIVRSWEGTWASDALQTPEFAAFQVPFEDADGGVIKAQKRQRKLLVAE